MASPREKLIAVLRLDRAMRLIWHSGRGWTIATIALLFFRGVLPLAALILVKKVVDAVAAGVASHDAVAAFPQVALYIALAGAVALLAAVSQSISGVVEEAQTEHLTDHVQSMIHAKSVEVDLAYYEEPRYYDTLHRAQREGTYRPARILQSLTGVGVNGLSLLTMVGLLISFNWTVALVLFLAALPGVFVKVRYAGILYRWRLERTPTERLAHTYDWMLTTMQYAKELRLFALGRHFRERYRELRKTLREERIGLALRRAGGELLTQAVSVLAVFGSFALIAYRTLQGVITLGDMVMYYQAFQRGLGYLQNLLGGLATLYEHSLYFSNLEEFLQLERRVADPSRPRPLPSTLREGLRFERVSFRYPDAAGEAVKEFDLTVRAGETLALVGENGSGKTTLAKLLCRLYDPTEGRITADGIDIRHFRLLDWRRRISTLSQDFSRYPLTARENIHLGDLEQPDEEEAIASAARAAGADEVLAGLPRGYESPLGRWFEQGVELSAGQWQKVALARTFFRSAEIAVLDEPSSMLDPAAEAKLLEELRRWLRGRTALVISHRFTTVLLADRVALLEKGRLTAVGTHEQLLRENETYAGMVRAQTLPS